MRTLRLLCAATALGLTGFAQAQDATYVVSYIEVAPSARTAALPLLRALRDAGRKEAGNGGFDILQRIDRTGQFAIVEKWQDAKAQASHAEAADAKSIYDKFKPLLAAPIDARAHSGYAAGERKAAGLHAIYVLTHVDLIGAKKDEGRAALKQLSADSAKDAGVLRYDVLQQTSRPNHLTLVEAWRGRAALEAHEAAAHTRKFRDALLPMSGSLYDQRLYKAIR
ncbi:MAG TPA: antibiotic biosynthesis monooxygenase [Pseudolabrys sp.]|jgi:quinol monooxygenase YgiN